MGCGCGGSSARQQVARQMAMGAPQPAVSPGDQMAQGGPGTMTYYWNGPTQPAEPAGRNAPAPK